MQIVENKKKKKKEAGWGGGGGNTAKENMELIRFREPNERGRPRNSRSFLIFPLEYFGPCAKPCLCNLNTWIGAFYEA